MSRESAVSAIERGDLSELQRILDKSQWDIKSEPLNSEGQTAFHIACANGHLDIVQYMVIKVMGSVSVRDDEILGLVEYQRDHISHSEEGLQIARSSGNLHIVHYLLKCYQCIPDGISDVHFACIMGDMDTVKTALESNGPSILGIADLYGTTPMHYATLEPNVLRMIVQYAGEMLLNTTDSMGNTPLHHSIKYECIESVTILVEAPGCDVNIANLKGETPLIAACKQSSSAMVPLLVASEICDINTSDNKGNTALHVAVTSKSVGQLENVECLLESDRCDPNVINKSGYTSLHIVCQRDDIPLLEALLTDKRCDLNIQDGNGDTALHIGVKNVAIVKCLLESGRSRGDIYNEKGLTPLHKAIANAVMASVQLMLKNGANILQTTNDKFQNAPIHIACMHSRLDILKVLLDCSNCDPNQQNAVGDTALHIVCRMRTGRELESLELQCLLQSDKCNPNVINKSGRTPLHIACHQDDFPLLEGLVTDKRCDLNIQDGNGDTALHIGVEHGKIVKCLLESGRSRCDIYNEKGLTPFHEAIANGVMASVQLMLKNGVNILQTTNDKLQNAPIHIACMHSRLDILKVIFECDPNQQNAVGDTALHIVCRMRTGRELEPLVFQCLLQSDKCDPNVISKSGLTPLHIACHRGDIPLLEALVADKRCDLNIQDGNGDTALHIGVENIEIVKCLLESGRSKCDIYNKRKLTPFHKAIANGVMASVQLMLKNGVNILQTTNDVLQNAPIHIACIDSRLDILEVLLACKNCDPNQQNAVGDTALHIVCGMRTGRELESLELQCLLQSDKCDPNVINKSGCTPLHIACHQGDFSLLEGLVADKRCDLNIQDGNGDTALHIGVENIEIVKCLLESGRSRCDIYNKEGLTPFHEAITNGVMASVQLMLKNGVNILQTTNDKFKDAPIHIACTYSRLDILEVLLACKNCDPNQQDAEGDTALHMVCRMRTGRGLMFLKLLISTPGINPTLLNNDGIAPIQTACRNSRLESLKVLLSCKGCDPNQQNTRGDTALHIVCRMSTTMVLQFLEVLTSTPGINPTLVNDKGIGPFEVHVNDKNNGNTFLHNACAEGNTAMVELLVKNGADVLKCNRYGDSTIHIACKHARLDILKVVLNSTNCDPNQQNAEGDTALHIVCRMRTGSTLQFLEVLTSTRGINPTLVNYKCIGPFEEVDGNGNTLLHNACIEGDTRIVRLLLKNEVDVLKCNRHGDAPLHIACKHARLDLLKLLLNSTNCDPNQQNARGDTVLHIVCRENFPNEKQLLNTLTSIVGIDPEIVNHNGHTPIEVGGINYTAIDTLKKILEHKRSSIQAYLKIFVVGNSGTGKSTLIKAVTTEASQLRKYAPLPKMKYVNTSDVPPHTAGIVPIPFNSKHFGNAVLYDFAGQHEYYSSHAAVMENLILPSPPLFLLLIDISKSKEVIREELVYWWHFINNQSQKAAAPPHVILAGSHKDMVKSGDREEVKVMIKSCIKRIPVTFEFVGYFPLDCRKLVSQGLNVLLTQLNTTCQTLRGIVNVNLHCHILNALLRAPEFQDFVYCKLVDIIDKIESDDAPLPKTFSQLIPLLKSLNDQGYILLLHNHTDESKSWVILKPDVLLTEVNGSVFAPKYFKKHSQFAMSIGVVPFSKLKEKFIEYNHEVIAAYLTHLEFCFRIKDQHTLDMITKNIELTTTEEYYFFPALVRVENPTDVCLPHQSIAYECGWLYKCSKETEQLTTRFLHVLILRLAFSCDPPDDLTETESVVLLRSCSVWKHGIAWWTNDGIEVIVEVGLQCHWVAVMLRSPDVKMAQCAELRSKVIHTVLKAKMDFCSAIAMTEYLIAPSSLKYPFEGRELTVYSMREVAKATIEGKEYAKDIRGKNLITLPQLLPFEPYENMGDLIWKFFSGDTSATVTAEELTQLAEKCHDKLAELKTAFKPDVGSFQRECEKTDCTEVERCVALFHILQRRGRFMTWRDFQQEFSRFSIFCKQSPLEHTQKDKDRTLGDDTECSMASDGVRASDDVRQLLPGPVPKSPIQLPSQYMPHTSTDIASAEGTAKEESEKESDAHLTQVDTTHLSDNTTYQAVSEKAGLTPTMIHLENEVIPTVCPMWREVGRQLHLKTSILDEIDADCRGVRRCCTRMFEEWLKEDTEATWYAVLSACKKVKENLASGPDELRTKESIESLKQLISNLPDFFATL